MRKLTGAKAIRIAEKKYPFSIYKFIYREIIIVRYEGFYIMTKYEKIIIGITGSGHSLVHALMLTFQSLIPIVQKCLM